MKENNKKILIFSTAYYPLVGGAEVAIKEITDRITDNFSFDLITLRFDKNLPKQEKIGKINVYRLGFTKRNPTSNDLISFPVYLNKILFPILALFRARSLDKKNNYDGFWSMMSYAGFPIVLFRKFFRKVPFLLTLQEGDNLEKVNKRLRVKLVSSLFKKIFREAKFVQPISNYLAEFSRKMKVKDEKIKVVPNGISQLNTEIVPKEEAKRLFGLDFSGKIIISTSRLVYKNAIDVLIKSLKFLPFDYYLVVAGDGPEKDNLLSLAKKEKILERIRFLDYIPNEKIYKFLSVGDVFARISRTEGQGISFLEAMNVGLPVVASNAGGITDFIKDGQTGLIAEIENPLDVAEKIKKIIDDQGLRNKIISQAKQLVIEKYDWDLLYKEIQDLLENL